MNKKVAIMAKPEAANTRSPDQWVRQEGGGFKRLTIDIPEALHRRFKAGVAQKGRTMAQEILEFIESNY